MTRGHRMRLRLSKLWHAQYGQCHWCKEPTDPPHLNLLHADGVLPPTASTIDHLYPRGHPLRGATHSTVLACHLCNDLRNRANFPPKKGIPDAKG